MKFMKNNYIIHDDSLDIFEWLTDEQIWKLFRKIRDYHKEELYISNDQIVDICYITFKNQFDRDEAKYKQKSNKNKDIAKNRRSSERIQTHANACEHIQTHANVTDKDNDNDKDKDKDNDKDNVNDNYLQFWENFKFKIEKKKYNKLLELYTKEKVDNKIYYLENYCLSKWKKYKDYWATIHNRLIKETEKENKEKKEEPKSIYRDWDKDPEPVRVVKSWIVPELWR